MTSCLSQGISSIIFMIIHKPGVLGQLMHMHKVIVPKVWLFKHLFCGLLLQEEISPVFEEHSKIQAGWEGFEVQMGKIFLQNSWYLEELNSFTWSDLVFSKGLFSSNLNIASGPTDWDVQEGKDWPETLHGLDFLWAGILGNSTHQLWSHLILAAERIIIILNLSFFNFLGLQQFWCIWGFWPSTVIETEMKSPTLQKKAQIHSLNILIKDMK